MPTSLLKKTRFLKIVSILTLVSFLFSVNISARPAVHSLSPQVESEYETLEVSLVRMTPVNRHAQFLLVPVLFGARLRNAATPQRFRVLREDIESALSVLLKAGAFSAADAHSLGRILDRSLAAAEEGLISNNEICLKSSETGLENILAEIQKTATPGKILSGRSLGKKEAKDSRRSLPAENNFRRINRRIAGYKPVLVFIFLSAVFIFATLPYSYFSVRAADGKGRIPQAVLESKNLTVHVEGVVDGDTIDIELKDGTIVRVRYLGVDTPEVRHTSEGIESREYYGKEAAEFNAALLERAGWIVRLERDPNSDNLGRYGRLLRHPFVKVPVKSESGEEEESFTEVLVTEELIREGYSDLYWPGIRNLRYGRRFLRLRRTARRRGIGMWDTEAREAWDLEQKEKRGKTKGGLTGRLSGTDSKGRSLGMSQYGRLTAKRLVETLLKVIREKPEIKKITKNKNKETETSHFLEKPKVRRKEKEMPGFYPRLSQLLSNLISLGKRSSLKESAA